MPSRQVTLVLEEADYAWAVERARREGSTISEVLAATFRRAREEDEAAAARAERREAAWDEVVDWLTDGEGISEEKLEIARRELEETE